MIYELINKHLPDNYKRYCDFGSDEAKAFINALERAWITGDRTDSKGRVTTNTIAKPFWSDELGDVVTSKLIYALSKAGWVISTTRTRYSAIALNIDTLTKYITTDKQLQYRTNSKVNKFRLRYNDEHSPANLTKTPSGIKETGLNRPGFAKSAKQGFLFDTNALLENYTVIQQNLVKSMTKMGKKYPHIYNDSANYETISKEILDWHLCNPQKRFNMEENISDQRGRAIYTGLKRVFNPVANKDARSLLIVDKPVFITPDNTDALNDIYLFIAELSGSKAKSWDAKKFSGKVSYANRFQHHLDPTNSQDRKEWHENIWLDRIYNALDDIITNNGAMWYIPLEMDQGMSLAQIAGITLNEKRLMDITNVVKKSNLKDPWFVEGVPRLETKTSLTPHFYGSSQSFKKLLKGKNLELSKDQMKLLKKEYKTGAFSIVGQLKDMLINHSNVQTPTFEVDFFDEKFTVEVNKHKAVGATLKAYTGYSSKDDKENIFMIHTPITIPDYAAFKTFFPTLLI